MKLKKKKGVLIALAAICVSIVAFTSEPFDSSLVVVNQKSGVFQVLHQGAKAGKVLLKISNTIGKEFSIEANKAQGGTPVIVAMEPGEYTIQIIDGKGRQIQRIPYQIKNANTGFQITKIADADDFPLPLSHPNNKLIHVRIFDAQNKLVHEQELGIKGNYGLVYTLKKIAGEATFGLTDEHGQELVKK